MTVETPAQRADPSADPLAPTSPDVAEAEEGSGGSSGQAPGDLRSRRRRRRFRRLAIVLVAVLIVLAGTAAWLVFDSPLTDIRTVDVTGVSVPQADEIRQAAAVPMGEAMATLPTAEVAARVQPLPGVAAVTVQRKWPHTVVVDVVPRTVVGYVPAGSGAELVGSDGTSMGTVPAAPEGATQIKASGEDRTQVALALAGVPAAARGQIASAEVQRGVIMLTLADGRGTVKWGTAQPADVKGKALAVLLDADQNSSWFDLSTAGYVRTADHAPAGSVAGAAANPTTSASAGTGASPSASASDSAPASESTSPAASASAATEPETGATPSDSPNPTQTPSSAADGATDGTSGGGFQPLGLVPAPTSR